MQNNSITIFSNGMVDVTRVIELTGGGITALSIPVKKDHISDVLASVTVYGDVDVRNPVSYHPANETDGTLSVNSQNALFSLITQLSGSRVRVETSDKQIREGALAGLHKEEQVHEGESFKADYLDLFRNGGIERIAINEVKHLHFLEEQTQVEIDKALRRQYQTIKPQSTFIDVELASDKPTTALLQYIVPGAAWKMSYRLLETADNKLEFQGLAIVDNNTDEDWNEVTLSVVTGEPVTFTTDIADSKMPQRDHVNIVKTRALGSVEIEECVEEFMSSEFEVLADIGDAPRAAAVACAPGAGGQKMESARLAATEIKEVGDFSVFKATNLVTLSSKRSAVIPMFSLGLKQSKKILHFKKENHPDRPFRCVHFVNESSYNLVRGVCTIYEDRLFSGECVLPAIHAGDDALLPHALETGVKIHCKNLPRKTSLEKLRLSKGTRYESSLQEQESVYRFKNVKETSFQLYLDHEFLIPNCKDTEVRINGELSKEKRKELKGGFRWKGTLPAGQSLKIEIKESLLEERKVSLSGGLQWIQNHVLSKGSFSQNPKVQECLKMQEILDKLEQEYKTLEAEAASLVSKQKRLRENLKIVSHQDQSDQWRIDLADAEKRISEIDEKLLPKLNQEKITLGNELKQAIKALSVTWEK